MNIPYEAMKAFDSTIEYRKRIVAFVDVMGIKNRITESTKPEDFKMYSVIMSMFENQPFAEGKLHISAFSDCMYVIADEEYIDLVINLFANFSYKLLFNNMPCITIHSDGTTSTENHFDCFKLRGGITYGEVYVVDEVPGKNGIPLRTNIVLGKAAMDAYHLESKIAVYPRIIVDSAFGKLLNQLGKTKEEYFLVEDNHTIYLDFLDYMCRGRRNNNLVLYGLEDCIEFVENEIEAALQGNNAKLVGQLLWYKQYLQSHISAGG